MLPHIVAKQAGEEIRRRLVSDVKIMEIIPVGSVRRKAEHVEDLDFLVVVEKIPKKITLTLSEKKNGIVEFADQSKDRAASSAAVRHITSFLKIKTAAPVKVDFFVCTPKEKPFMLFHYTGSRAYNIRTRALAKRKKWKLNQYGLYHFSNRRVKGSGQIKTENDLAKFLGVSYRPPENRIK